MHIIHNLKFGTSKFYILSETSKFWALLLHNRACGKLLLSCTRVFNCIEYTHTHIYIYIYNYSFSKRKIHNLTRFMLHNFGKQIHNLTTMHIILFNTLKVVIYMNFHGMAARNRHFSTHLITSFWVNSQLNFLKNFFHVCSFR